MTTKEVKKRVKVLRKEINRLRDKYNNEDISEISDEALDSLKKELKDIEKKYPELLTTNSPTNTISGGVKKGFKKIKHKVKQWSFNDIFEKEELLDFHKRNIKNLNEDVEYFLEEKIDGMKVVLEYEKGNIKSVATRGDGVVGEDITENAYFINDIPKKLKKPVSIIVEGELYIEIKEFNRINKLQEKMGLEKYANPRNLAAGSVRQLDIEIMKERDLKVFAYDVALYENDVKTQKDERELLNKLGFKTSPNFKLVKNVDEILEFWENLDNNLREKLNYWIDGVVIKINDNNQQRQLGYTGKAPRFAIAFKFKAEQSTSVLIDIVFQIGRTGIITPVAEFDEILLSGTKVKRATLHNEDRIKELDIRIGDTIIIQKAGDIIPEVVDVIKNLRNKKSKKFIWPKRIKDCGGSGEIVRKKGSADYKCVNLDNKSVIVKKLAYFASKNALDIDGLGESTIKQFYEKGLINNYKDIFNLKKEKILLLDGWREKSADNLLSSIEEKRTITLDKLLVALSIDGVGTENAILLSKRFNNLQEIINAKKEDLDLIHGIGDVVAISIIEYMKQNKKIVLELLKELSIKKMEIVVNKKVLNKKIAITGKFQKYKREEIKKILREQGASISTSVSSKTDILLLGEDSGEKRKKAEKFNVEIIKESGIDELLKL